MSKISLSPSASGTGNFTIASPNSSTDRTLTLPDNTGTIITTASTFGGTGPAFSAYLGSNQSITSGVFTKIQFNTESFDTNNNYDNSTNYRFTPTVAGYYQINGKFASTVNTTLLVITMYKNGSEAIRGADNRVSQNAGSSVQISTIIYCNGTTDYLELYGYIAGTSPAFQSSVSDTWFQGFLARAA